MRRLPSEVAHVIHRKLEAIAADPRHHGSDVKKLKSRPAFRLRIGDWRAIFVIIDDKILEVVRVTSRREAYKR